MSTVTARSVLEKHYGYFFPIYADKCGNGDTYHDVAGQFSTYLDGASIATQKMMRIPSSRAISIFQNFIDNGGCHPESPTGRVISAARELNTAQDPAQRLAATFGFMDAYLHKIDRLDLLSSIAIGMQMTPLYLRESIRQLADHSERILTRFWDEIREQFNPGRPTRTVSNIWNEIQNRFEPAERAVAYAQVTLAETIYHAVNAFLTGIDPSQHLKDEHLPRLLTPFRNVYNGFKNPFKWIRWAYSNGTFGDTSLKITAPVETPAIEPANPNTTRRIIDLIVSHAALKAKDNHPIELQFAWDGAERKITITSKDLALLPQSLWNDIANLAGEWDKRIIHLPGGQTMVAIPVPLKGDTIQFSPQNGSGSIGGIIPASFEGGGSIAGLLEPNEGESMTSWPVWSPVSASNPNIFGIQYFQGARWTTCNVVPALFVAPMRL